jgi:trimeric autotransporter adhesin
MDHLHERLERLEQRTHTAERQLRWWRGLACGLVVVSLLSLMFPSGNAADAQSRTSATWLADLQDKLKALESLLRHIEVVTTPDGLQEVVITGANLRIVNGLGSTDCRDEASGTPIPDCPNGVGNLIVGYNEMRLPEVGPPDRRTGSHNIIVGQEQNFSSFGGLVAGFRNEISGEFASISGGFGNTASGFASSVSGGEGNRATGSQSSVSGGINNSARGLDSAVSGGSGNTASEFAAAVSGGGGNVATGPGSAVSGGFGNTASGNVSAVSGGSGNTASGFSSAVSGGRNRTAAGDFDWVAGSLLEDE